MRIRFLKFQRLNKAYLSYFENEFENNREYELLKKLISDSSKNRSTIYVLEIDNKRVGILGLTFDRLSDSPVLSIDYLFVIKSLRGKTFEEMFNKKISEFMILYSLDIAKKINEVVAVRYLALYPDMQDENLTNYYLSLLPNSFKLKENNETWILLKV